MKIKQISMKNFANFGEFTCNLGNGVNYICGGNGSGKSTTGITAIWACLQGIAEKSGNGCEVLKGKRDMWVGRYGTDSEVTIILTDPDGIDYTINRKISENKLEITASDGRKLGQDWINGFWNSMMLSPVAFSRLTPKEQAAYMGIDVSEFDQKISEYKDEASFLRREIKAFGEIEIPEKVEAVDVSELSRDKDKIVRFNQEQDRISRERIELDGRIKSLKQQREELTKRLSDISDSIGSLTNDLTAMPIPQGHILTTEIDQKISEASEVNTKAIAYQQAIERQAQKERKEQELSENKSMQDAEIAKKVAYMQGLDLPFSNLSIDDNGGLMMDGRPIQSPHFSTGELIKICTILMASRAPEWKYVFLQEFDLLDPVKSKEVLDWLLENDFQVLAEKISENQEVLILQDV